MADALEAFETMKKYYHERDLAAREWKDKGERVVGCVGTSVPEELIIAAGCLPIQVTGNPYISTAAGDEFMEDIFCPYVRSIHNLFVMGEYDFFDLVIFPHGNDSVTRCYFYLWTEKMTEPELRIPPITLFDNLHTRKYIANRYVRGRLAALKEELETLWGNKITPGALSDAIAVCNENRMLLKRIADLRRADPPRISGVEALQIIGASFFMPKEQHNQLLKDFLAGADQLPSRNGTRLYVSGSILDNTQLYELLESCGATIVSEDVATGNRYADNPVDTTMDQLDALADRYHMKSNEGKMLPISKAVDYVAQGVQESGAQGVVFNYMRWDDTHTWNYPSQRNALEAMGVPSIAFDMQEYKLASPEQLRTRTEAFIEMIRGGK